MQHPKKIILGYRKRTKERDTKKEKKACRGHQLNRFKCYFSSAVKHLTLSQCVVEEHSDNGSRKK